MGTEGRVEIAGLCDRCMGCGAGGSDEQTLYDLAHMDDRTLSSLMHDSQYGLKELHEKAWEHARRRLSRLRGTIESKRGELQDLKEGFSYKLLEQLAAGGSVDELLDEYIEDESRRRLEEELAAMDRMEEAVEPEDIRDSLKEYVEKDLIELDGEGVKITPKGADADRTIFYLHGGGYVIGSVNTHRDLMARISRASGFRVLGLDYRLAPEHPFPAADMNESGWQARWIAVKRRGVGRARIGASEIKLDRPRHQLNRHHRIGRAVLSE